MANRLYLTYITPSASYDPATQSQSGRWDKFPNFDTKLRDEPTDFLETIQLPLTNGGQAQLAFSVSDPLTIAGTLRGQITTTFGCQATTGNPPNGTYIHVWVTVGDTATLRGTLLDNVAHSTDWPSTAQGLQEVYTANPVSVEVGDRVIVELGFHDGSDAEGKIWLGAFGASDLQPGDTDVENQPGWVQFEDPEGVVFFGTPNDPPVADAGPDQAASTGATVNLDGTGSSDPESTSLSYEWTVFDDAGTGLTNADLINRLTATPFFTAPDATGGTADVIIQLGVTDSGFGDQGPKTDTDQVTITIQAPTDAGEVSTQGGYAVSMSDAEASADLQYSQTVVDAVEANDREVFGTLRADWDRDGFTHPLSDLTSAVESVRVSRSLTGDLPAEVSLVEGYSSTELSATLAGEVEGKSIFEAFAPYRNTSELALSPKEGAPVEFDVNIADTAIRQFTGHIRSSDLESSTREVLIDALDPSDRLRAKITLPSYGIAAYQLVRGNDWGVNSQWVIDHVLRRNGIYVSPPSHPNTVVGCTAHGGLAADVGESTYIYGSDDGNLRGDEKWYTDGPFGLLAARGHWYLENGNLVDANDTMSTLFTAHEGYKALPGTGVGMAAWVKTGSNAPDIPNPTGDFRHLFNGYPVDDESDFRFDFGLWDDGRFFGGVFSRGVYYGATTTYGGDFGWRYLGLHWRLNYDGTVHITWRVDGTTYTFDTEVSNPSAAYREVFAIKAKFPRDWCDLQCWLEFEPPEGVWPGEFHTPVGRLDPGLNELSYLPDVVNEDSWELIQAVAGAEYGVVGFTEEGRFRFRNRRSLAKNVESVEKAVTADRSLKGFGGQVSVDTIRNAVTLSTRSAYLEQPEVVIKSRDVKEFETPIGRWTYLISMPFGVPSFTNQVIPHISNADVPPDEDYTEGFVAVRAAEPNVEIVVGEPLRVTWNVVGRRLIRLTVRNYTKWPVRFATTDNRPALRSSSYGLRYNPPVLAEIRNTGSIEQYGERVFGIAPNPWRQRIESLRPIANTIATELANPSPNVERIPIVGDPTIRLNDTIEVVDPDGYGSLRASVVGIERELSRTNGLTDALDIRPIAPPGLGIADDSELGLADDTLILGT